ncbi:MAG: DNA repair protein RecO [Desulfobacterales bacterium]
MSSFSSPAILIRRIDHRDYDLILTFLTLDQGKISAIAKYAKKSIKRFSGILELFYILDIVCIQGKARLPVMKEASLRCPFLNIRCNIVKTAYAGYWAQLVDQWMEEGQKEPRMFGLFQKALKFLDQDTFSPEVASIFFQMKFLAISGIYPNFDQCNQCGLAFDKIKGDKLIFDLGRGALMCKSCAVKTRQNILISRGVVKQLLWITEKSAEKFFRIRFSVQAQQESLFFLETFVPFHLGIRPKSLAFLKQIREKETLETNICIKD